MGTNIIKPYPFDTIQTPAHTWEIEELCLNAFNDEYVQEFVNAATDTAKIDRVAEVAANNVADNMTDDELVDAFTDALNDNSPDMLDAIQAISPRHVADVRPWACACAARMVTSRAWLTIWENRTAYAIYAALDGLDDDTIMIAPERLRAAIAMADEPDATLADVRAALIG